MSALKEKLQNDKTLVISVGRSRRSKSWKNKEVKWSYLVERLQEPRRTEETTDEYKRMAKTKQADVKDVGGFVGGTLKGGRRVQDAVAWRSMIALDVDRAPKDFWLEFTILFPYACILHSTHSHTPESPRYRILIPLEDNATPDKYQAASVFLAQSIGMQYFDDTTYQPERLMYWPSCPSDGEYVFHYQDGPFLNVEDILSEHPGWRDLSLSPISERIDARIQKDIKRQGDPAQKPATVGAFCRAYDIHEAMQTFIPGVYEATDDPSRYTYIEGEGHAGLKIYDYTDEETGETVTPDAFCYSHHSTDPISGRLLNAFDMVRIHRYGHLDVDEYKTINSTPSYVAMTEFCVNDAKVRMELGSQSAEEVFADYAEEEADDPDAWRALLQYQPKSGRILKTIHNAYLIIKNDERLKGKITFDEFRRNVIVDADVPWRKETGSWSETDESALAHFLERAYDYKSRVDMRDAFMEVKSEKSFHPVQDYLKSLEWDGISRIDSVLVDHMGAEDNAYTRAVTRKWLCGAAARILRPGVKFDWMLILVGKQGAGKSQFFNRISVNLDWFSDSIARFENTKETMEQLAGKWIIEIGELSAMRKREVEEVKAFLSKREDTYRPPYGRNLESFRRQCVFAGTTNEDNFLKDITGGRRFWPVAVGRHKITMWETMTDEIIEQIWAEAVHLVKKGENLYLSKDEEAAAQLVQAGYTDVDERVGSVQEFLDKKVPENLQGIKLETRRAMWIGAEYMNENVKMVKRDKIAPVELFVEFFGKSVSEYKAKEQHEMNRILKQAGWEKSNTNMKVPGNGRQRYYMRVDE